MTTTQTQPKERHTRYPWQERATICKAAGTGATGGNRFVDFQERFFTQNQLQELTASADGAPKSGAILRTTEDQIYLAGRINDTWTGRKPITPAAIQRWNNRHGVRAVSDALRTLRGFPPEEALRNPYAYVDSMLKNGETK